MKALRFIRVDIGIWAPYVEAYYEELLFAPLVAVHEVKHVEVFASWEEPCQQNRLGDRKEWPFILHREMVSRW
jgi:hypothetical protein